MRKSIIMMLSFATIFTCVQAHTLAENPSVNNNIAAGTAIIIDVGSGILRAGPANVETPAVSISHNFAERGTITDWNGFENTLTQMYSQLGINAANHPVIIAEPPLNSKIHKEKTAELFFNKFNVPSLYIAKKTVLVLYATGRYTGMVVHSGYGASYIEPVYEGYSMSHAIMRSDMGGRDLADYMSALLKDKGVSVSRDVAADINSKLGYVASNLEKEKQKSVSTISKSYTHNGKQITIEQERFQVPEGLFQPPLAGIELKGIHRIAYDAIMKCNLDKRKYFYANIVLSGSNTVFPGTKERVKTELTKLAPAAMKVSVIAPSDREFLAWKGGKILAPVLTQNNMWLSKAEFDSKGSTIVHKKFF